MNYDEIGKFILKLRKEKGYSQNDLARMIPISRQAISKWERGVTIPDSSTLVRLSEIFDVSINELLKGEKLQNNSIEELQKTTLDIVDDSVLRTRNLKKKITILIFTILLLLISFFIYYFINSYNSIKIYYITAESEHFRVDGGLFITTSVRKYYKLDSLKYDMNMYHINNVKLYYKKNNNSRLIIDDESIDQIILDLDGYDYTFSDNDLKYVLKDSYLEINYNDDQTEIIPIHYQRSFVNDNLLFFQKKSEYNDNNNKNKYSELNRKVVEKIISSGQTNNNEYYDYFFVNDKQYRISYFKKSAKLSLYYEYNMLSNYYLYSDYVYCSNPIENCKKYYYDLAKNYIK